MTSSGRSESSEEVNAVPEQSSEQWPTNIHRVVVEFDDGIYIKKLIHPASGCKPATQCANCGRITPDSATEGRYSATEGCDDCADGFGDECWVQGWVDNMTAEEILHGRVELVVEPESDWEGCTLTVIGGQAAKEESVMTSPNSSETHEWRKTDRVDVSHPWAPNLWRCTCGNQEWGTDEPPAPCAWSLDEF